MQRRHLLPLLAAPALITRARAQGSSQGRPITLIVPYAAGGGTDIVARELAPILMEMLGQNVIVENRGGAAGHVGATSVARARPDGTTLLFAVSTNIVVNPHLQRNDRVNLSTALSPVTKASAYQYVLAIDPKVPAKDLQELIAAGKKPRAGFTFSSGGVGSNNHLAGILFAEAAGVEMEHISYRGTAPALQDVVAGRVTMNFSSPPPAVPLVRDGRLRALAVTGDHRLPSLPEVPTLSEAGLPGIVILGWHGIFAPAGTPEAEMSRLEAAANKAIRDPRFARSLERDGLEVAAEQPRADFARAIREEYEFWGRKVRELDLKAE
ncbi:Bug family tripartite tricarboxylate transporter substrate binding protein [Muricoccus pecuniae]|uniref:Tripartite-type tricarboxylate transporter receptor subunit TctC n=1 Tax=Muricoccus pecuniae TaxID=693023 RepID=A0A840Y286_9PROT|nr:tripartite tricarboxylate transporter substrate binding protein [Roseomonas pecuniae]MBB5695218.1 tripartite-type tricarboxylate transporter receptor subunit TctC [Roseomonas pecuniae]